MQKIIANRPNQFLATDYIGKIDEQPVNWMPTVHYNIANQTQLAVVIDLKKGAVVQTQTVEVNPLEEKNLSPEAAAKKAANGEDPNGFSIDYITGVGTAPNFIQMDSPAITFTSSGVQTTGNVLLVNALMTGGSGANACNPAKATTDYWAQIGFYWKTSGQINYDDTSTGCAPVFSALTYTPGNNYRFNIRGDASGWRLAGINLGTAVAFSYTGPAVNSGTFKTSDSSTSVFFENKQISSVNWAPQFGSNPSATAKYSTNGGSTQLNWPDNVRIDQSCTGTVNTYPYSATNEVMTGELKSGGTATWSMSRMAANYPRC
ncbi:hypothetical protein [Nitrososphaera viennensis]|uniref:Uncharacterized protein n=2 Tax=Nitrososphaera viennensis TaxID=1034015 RepID=A0A060HF97_9ARCH|nr:hypothetical protein [Nitrososphaera viennensis]AIC15309.1 hypothetical protein NVIE_010810 [Nitrososphaera viennensis EN76]UVS70211.1 hypothetical protein NWT39_05340 [Nitrososphaera viennensis]